MPTWVKVAIDASTTAAGIAEGYVFRPVNRADPVAGERLSEKVVWQLLQPYAEAGLRTRYCAHDLRRSCATLCRAAGGELEQIQLLLGHASVQTTERYLGTKQDLVHAERWDQAERGNLTSRRHQRKAAEIRHHGLAGVDSRPELDEHDRFPG